ncbi:MAG TPA: peptide chain release factor N(5)-glutamine methyltransferase [Pyrinomonadaceae bacterium]|nr:peptide chain release factor N(5)-glutamine methyltransferase [Pyrinomonadaceae bacterium]
MNIADTLKHANAALVDAGLKEPQKDARLLLRFALQRAKEFLFAHPEYELSDAEKAAFDAAIGRRSQHEPVQYIIGTTEFYGLEFNVSPAVLIPRPETEILVENAVNALKGNAAARLCEIGVGSGCISVAMLTELPTASAIAVDRSPDALAIARQNAERHKVLDRLDLLLSDVFDSVGEDGFDAVVSNPPYISLAELATLDREVREFEPEIALSDNADGLEIIRKIIAGSSHKLRPGGVLFLEIGYGQSERILPLFSPRKWTDVRFFSDLQSIPRILRAFRL